MKEGEENNISGTNVQEMLAGLTEQRVVAEFSHRAGRSAATITKDHRQRTENAIATAVAATETTGGYLCTTEEKEEVFPLDFLEQIFKYEERSKA